MSLADLLFPPSCFACQRPGSLLCPDCRHAFPPHSVQYCPICHRPSPLGFTHRPCLSPFVPEVFISLFPYTGPIKKAIWRLKYRFVSSLAPALASLATQEISLKFPELLKNWRHDFILAPIPLHPLRTSWRGFNQSALLAEELAVSLKLKLLPDLLLRRRYTKSQAKLSSSSRLKNLHLALLANPLYPLKNQNLLVFDDVSTTGATLLEAARALKKAGAHQVHCLSLSS